MLDGFESWGCSDCSISGDVCRKILTVRTPLQEWPSRSTCISSLCVGILTGSGAFEFLVRGRQLNGDDLHDSGRRGLSGPLGAGVGEVGVRTLFVWE